MRVVAVVVVMGVVIVRSDATRHVNWDDRHRLRGSGVAGPAADTVGRLSPLRYPCNAKTGAKPLPNDHRQSVPLIPKSLHQQHSCFKFI